MHPALLALITLVSYAATGFGYTQAKLRLYGRLFRKKEAKLAQLDKAGLSSRRLANKFTVAGGKSIIATNRIKEYDYITGITWWERALSYCFWPTNLGDIPTIKNTDKETRMIHAIAIEKEIDVQTYYAFNFILWPIVFAIMFVPHLIIVPSAVVKAVLYSIPMNISKKSRAKTLAKEERKQKLIEAKLEAEKTANMLPAARLHQELNDKKTVISNYIRSMDQPDAVYNILKSELEGMIKKAGRLVNDYSRFKNYAEGEYLTEKAIYAAASEDWTIFTAAKHQIMDKKETLSSFLEEVLAKVNVEIDKVSTHKNQEEKNVEALEILASLGREVRELDFKTRSYFDSEVLKVMNLLGSLMDDTLNQDKVSSMLEQLRQDSHGLTLAQISLEGNDSYQDWQDHTIGFLSEVDQKIAEIKDKLHLPTAQVLRLQEQKIA